MVSVLKVIFCSFALTIAGTFGAALLVLPKSLAPLGPFWAACAVFFAGLLSLGTQLLQSEAFVRHWRMDRPNAFLMRMSSDYLGNAPARVLRVVMLLYGSSILFAYLLGTSEGIESAVGIPAVLFIGALGVLCVRFAGSLHSTLTVAMIMTSLSIVLVVLLAVVAWQITPSLAEPLVSPNFAPDLSRGTLAALSGVLLYTFCGHLTVVSTTRLMLPREPSGRAMSVGIVLALFTLAVLLAVWTYVFTSRFPVEELTQGPGTVIDLLAREVGTWVFLPGTLLIVLTLGYGSIVYASNAYMMVNELVGYWIERYLRGDLVNGANSSSEKDDPMREKLSCSNVARDLLRRLMKQRLMGGQHLSINDLVERTGLERSAVVFALKELVWLGTITVSSATQRVAIRSNLRLEQLPLVKVTPSSTSVQAIQQAENNARSETVQYRSVWNRFLVSGLGYLPTIFVVLLAAWAVHFDISNFSQALGMVGALICPFLVGVLPAATVIAARRQGWKLPVRGWAVPLPNQVIWAIAVFVIALPFANGIWFWSDPLARIASVAVGLLMIAFLLWLDRLERFDGEGGQSASPISELLDKRRDGLPNALL